MAERFTVLLPAPLTDADWGTVSTIVRNSAEAYGVELLEGPADRLYPVMPQFFIRDAVVEVYPVTRWAMATAVVTTMVADPPTVSHR